MAGTTPRYGFPYPTGTDRVADGDNAMQALATAVEDKIRICSGSTFHTLGTGSVAVTFPVGRFTATPAINVVAAASTGANVGFAANVGGVSNTGCTIYVYSIGTWTTGNISVYFAAFQNLT